MNDLFLYYIAGFIDAEGCLSVHMVGGGNPRSKGKKYPKPEITIRSSNCFILDEIRSKFGGNIHRKKKVKNSQQLFDYKIYGNDLREFLPLIENKLLIKKEQANLLKQLIETKRIKSLGTKLATETIELRDFIISELKALKRIDYGPYYQEEHSYPNKSTWTPEFVAYLAGLLDGDGHIGIIKRAVNQISTSIRVYNFHLPTLKQLTGYIGGRICVGHKPGKQWKTHAYILYTSTKTGRLLLPVLKPFIIMKHREVELIEQYHCCPSEQLDTRKHIINSLQEIRARGNRPITINDVYRKDR